MFSCFTGNKKKSGQKVVTVGSKRKPGISAGNESKQFFPTAGFHNDIVYYKFLNTDTYELDVSKIQVWMYDKSLTCIHATDNEFRADYYVGKHINEVSMKEDVQESFKDIHVLAQDGIESKRTVLINNRLAYIECRTLYYNEDVNDVYGSMMIIIPYKNVVGKSQRVSGNYVLIDDKEKQDKPGSKKRPTSLDTSTTKSKTTPVPVKRTLSDSNLNKMKS
jgi:hypothetical protein